MTASLIGLGVRRIAVPLLKAARGGKKVVRLDVEFPGAVSSTIAAGKQLRSARTGRFRGRATRVTTRGREGRILGSLEVDPRATRVIQRSNPLVRSTIRGFRRSQEFAAQHPVAAISGELLTLGVFGPPVAEFTTDLFSTRKLREEGAAIAQAQSIGLAQRMQQERMSKASASNLAMLAALRPEIYNQVAAGRVLPKGAIVIGGQPDFEGLGAVGSAMAAGAFQRPPTAEEAFLQTLR